MILTTPTNHSFTITKHNNKGYIFTLYLFMLLCVVGNCLLFYCSCTGNCENCCGINGNESVSGSSTSGSGSWSEIEFGNKDNKNNDIKENKVEKKIEENKEEKKIEKKEEEKIEKKEEEKKEDNKIENENKNKIDIKNKLKEIGISNEGKIGNIQIVNAEFVKKNLVKAYVYKCSSDNYEIKKEEFLNVIKPTYETYLSAYAEVKDNGTVKLQCFIECTDANSRRDIYLYYNGLFLGSAATEIEILRCGSEIENMRYMFCNCNSLTNITFHDNFNTNNVTDMYGMFDSCSKLPVLNLSSFNTGKVTNMSWMFNSCKSLTHLDLSKFNTTNVTDMQYMFNRCTSLKELDLSSFNTDTVENMRGMFAYCSSLNNLNLSKFNTNKITNMFWMFYNCFQDNATLICKSITIQKITDYENSCLIITNENGKKTEIKKTIENYNNKDKVYTCTVERIGNNHEITDVEEYQSQK